MKELEELKRLDTLIGKCEDELHYLEQDRKILDRCAAQLSRRERTHRLCTNGGILENFLRRPDLLTEAQVRQLLRFAFGQPAVRSLLEELLAEAAERERAAVSPPSALP